MVSVARGQRFNQSWLCNWASLVVQTVKHLPAMQETQVQFLSAKDSSGEGNGYPLFCNNTLIKPQKDKSISFQWANMKRFWVSVLLGEGMETQRPFFHTALSVHLFHLAILWYPFIMSWLSSVFLWVLWIALAIIQPEEGGYGNLWFTANNKHRLQTGLAFGAWNGDSLVGLSLYFVGSEAISR